jgi:hypothetical protein
MKASDVVPLTTLYRQQASKWESARRAVVLAVGTWAGVGENHQTGRKPYAAYREMTTSRWLGLHTGWLVLIASSYSEQDVPDERLLALAQPALDAIRDGRLPDGLPSGVSVELLGGREIVQTWAEHQEDLARSERARSRAEANLADTEAAEAAAKARIGALVDEATLADLASLVGYGRVQPWRTLEHALDAYAEAKASAGAPVG